ncbi:MAG: NADH-quinone oxidoreductase subunit NuoE [bacterium]
MEKKVDSILKKYNYDPNSIIQILDGIQDEFNYLPRETVEQVSTVLKIPLSKIYSIATFYSVFSLEPRGKHMITVCKGTACFVKGSSDVLKRIEDRLGITAGHTTEDKLFTLETVNCLGACALAPIIVVDGQYYGKTSVQKVDSILDKYQQSEERLVESLES